MALAKWIDIGRMDDIARMDSPVHRLDARAKAIVTFAFMLAVMSFPRHALSALTPFLLYPVGLMAAGRVPARPILHKILLATPFALAIGIFNPLLDRQPAAAIGPWVVSGGWLSFASILFRFLLTAWAAMALIATTGMTRLGAGLEQLGVPRAFVTQLMFLHRYLFVVAESGQQMVRGVEARAGSLRTPGLRVYRALLGTLLLRTLDRADRIHRAMVARGFDGRIRTLRPASFRLADWGFMVIGIAAFAIARAWNLADALGSMVLRIVT